MDAPASAPWPIPSERHNDGVAPVDMSTVISEASEHAAETLILSDVLDLLENVPALLSIIPACNPLIFTVKDQVEGVRASPDLSCTVKEALENEIRRGAHQDFTPKGQMNPSSVACNLYWALLSFSWALKTIEGIRDGVYVGVAAREAYHHTFESHHGMLLRQAFRTGFLLVSKMDPAPLNKLSEGFNLPVMLELCKKLEACYDEVGLFDERKV